SADLDVSLLDERVYDRGASDSGVSDIGLSDINVFLELDAVIKLAAAQTNAVKISQSDESEAKKQNIQYIGSAKESKTTYFETPKEYKTQPYKIDFVQLMWPIKLERKTSSEMGGALGMYFPSLDYAVIDDRLFGESFTEVWVHENIHRHNGAAEQNVRERTKYRVENTYYH
ncbi:MAG: hypothetical protein Q8O89_08145, partial [Nanoarchaeota archaeon]|nr:hypothetical protein [Nanoarchaeota archaeon]